MMNPDNAEPKKQQSVTKNLNLYWWSITGLAVWFLFWHTPPLLTQERKWNDMLVIGHIVAAGGLYLACAHNSLVTPTVNRSLHVWVGRIAMGLGVLGFVSGVFLVFGRFDVNGGTFGIMITLAGIIQLYVQWLGYRGIKEFQRLKAVIASLPEIVDESTLQDLKTKQQYHLKLRIYSMVALFVLACGAPAMIRVLDDANMPNATLALIASVSGLNLVHHLYVKRFLSNMDKSSGEATPKLQESGPSESTSLLV